MRRETRNSEAGARSDKPLMLIAPALVATVTALVETRHHSAKGTLTWITTHSRARPSSAGRLVRCPVDILMSVTPARSDLNFSGTSHQAESGNPAFDIFLNHHPGNKAAKYGNTGRRRVLYGDGHMSFRLQIIQHELGVGDTIVAGEAQKYLDPQSIGFRQAQLQILLSASSVPCRGIDDP